VDMVCNPYHLFGNSNGSNNNNHHHNNNIVTVVHDCGKSNLWPK